MAKTYIIAEAGVNHNGSVDLAHQLIEEAARIGADAIKFQSFQTDDIVMPNAPKAKYQKVSAPKSNTQYELLKSLELPKSSYPALIEACNQVGITFLSTPFDLRSLDFLLDLSIERIKISSGDITFGPLLLKAAQSGKPVILSTGMADEKEIELALAVLAYGYLHSKEPDSLDAVLSIYSTSEAEEKLKKNVTILHCTSEYPAPFEEINLKAMQTIGDRFSLSFGYSDHSEGILVPCLAVAMGASVIEKHITLDCSMEGPDHTASLDIENFSKMIEQIRLTEKILGNKEKQPSKAEMQNKPIVRRGLYLTKSIKKGDVIKSDDLKALRPAARKTPMSYWDSVNEVAEIDYQELDAL